MKKITTVIAIIQILTYGHLFAENKPAKSKIMIFNFQVIKSSIQKTEKRKKQKDYRYYSYIIPETISKKFKNSEKYKITRKNKSILTGNESSLDDIKKNYTSMFENNAQINSADFIISGLYEILDDTLHVRTYIYDSAKKDIQEITVENRETGIFLKDTTDSLADGIDAKLSQPQKAEIVKQDDSEKSPFLILATPLLYTTLGIDIGYLYPQGKWKDIYNKTIYYSPHLTFDLAKYLEFSLKYDFFQTDTENKPTLNYYKARVMGGSATLGLRLPVFTNLLICLSAGGGMSRSEIIVKPGKAFESDLDNEKSNDPSAEGEISLKLLLSSIQIKTGALYKRYFLKEENMDASVFFGGIGIHF